MQEIIFCLLTGDFKKADCTPIYERTFFVEYIHPHNGQVVLDLLPQTPSPRVLKTHLKARYYQRSLSEKRPKTIILIRNPKDILVSYYNFYRMAELFGLFSGSWDDYFELVKANNLLFGDPFDWYCSWWDLRHEENVLVMKYEDMVRDLPGCLRTLASFCECDVDDTMMSKILDRVSFQAMKENPMTNLSEVKDFHHDISPFIRKGLIGDWKNYFNAKQNKYIDDRCREKCLPIGLHFDFE